MCNLTAHSSHVAEGTRLHWVELGAGRPLVLLHGLANSHRTWLRVAGALAGTRRVLLLDLAGHGLSGRPDAPYTLDWHAATVGRWLDSLGLEDIDLVGHSFGGGVAQYLLLTHADRVRRLGLVASGGLGREVTPWLRLLALPGAERAIGPFLGPGTSIALRRLCRGAFSDDERRWQAWINSAPGTARALTRSVRGVIDLGGQTKNFLDRAREVRRLPAVALFWGERDAILPLSQAHRAVTQIHGARLTTFPCGHFPQLEQPERFLGALVGFLDDGAIARARLAPNARPAARHGWLAQSLRACVRGLSRWWRRRRRVPTGPLALLPARAMDRSG